MAYISYIFIWLFSYLLGTISLGDLIVRKFSGQNIRELGTGNPGASNIYAEISPKYGVVVFFSDITKGLLVTLPLVLLNYPTWIASISIWLLLAGHMVTTPWGKTGGTGMATAMGAAIGLLPFAALIAVVPSFFVLIITRRPSFTGATAFLLSIIAGWLIYNDLIASLSIILSSAAVLLKYQYQYRNLQI